MTEIQLDFIQTAGVGALALVLGTWLTGKLSFLKRFCVPSPVSGGIMFSLLTLVVYLITDVQISFDGTLKDVAMLVFFTFLIVPIIGAMFTDIINTGIITMFLNWIGK